MQNAAFTGKRDRCLYGEIDKLVSLSTNKSIQRTNDFELFRWNSVMAVDNNRKFLRDQMVYRSTDFSDALPLVNNRKLLHDQMAYWSFYFPRRTLYLSVDHHSFPLFFVTWKTSSVFPFQWMTSSASTITLGRSCLVFWKSAKLMIIFA